MPLDTRIQLPFLPDSRPAPNYAGMFIAGQELAERRRSNRAAEQEGLARVELIKRQQAATESERQRAAQIEARRMIGISNYKVRMEQLLASGFDPAKASTQALIENLADIQPDRLQQSVDAMADRDFRRELSEMEASQRMALEDKRNAPYQPTVGNAGGVDYFMTSPHSAQVIPGRSRQVTPEELGALFPKGYDAELRIGPSGKTETYSPKKPTSSEKPLTNRQKAADMKNLMTAERRLAELSERPEDWTEADRKEVNSLTEMIGLMKSEGAEKMPTVSNKSEFDALPKGAVFIGTDGRQYRKP